MKSINSLECSGEIIKKERKFFFNFAYDETQKTFFFTCRNNNFLGGSGEREIE